MEKGIKKEKEEDFFKIGERILGTKTKAQEFLFLLVGVKEVVRQGFYPEELKKVETLCQKYSIYLVKSKFKVQLKGTPPYSNEGRRVSEEEEGMYFVYFSKEEKKAWLASYYELINDHYSLGLLLGYPECCVKFFCENFKEEKTDLVLKPTNCWTNLSKREEDCVLLSHFPCRSNCQKSILLGKKYFQILKKYAKERAKELEKKLKVEFGGEKTEF